MIKGLARHLVIVDIDKKRVEGELMDLSHGAPYTSPVKLELGDYEDIHHSDLVVITAGRNRRPNESRLELTTANVFLIVTNPVDILAYAAYKLSKKPVSEVIGAGTVLDTARFRFLTAKHCNVDPRNVHGYVLGEHGESEFPVWSKVVIGGNLIEEHCPACERNQNCNHEEEFDKIFSEVRDSGARIIERKGETSYGIGLALVRITEAILNDENSILPVSCLVEGFHDIDDVYLSLPAVLNKNGVRQVLSINLNKEETELLKKSATILKKRISSIKHLLD
jgi:L-lactate dehydrogenase